MAETPLISSVTSQTLTKKDYKILALSSLGGALEFYDFVVFVFFTSTITTLFFPNDNPFVAQMNTLGIFAAGYLARPIGGLIMAHYGDKTGRKKMFTFSVFLMALPTLFIGLLPTYETIGLLAPFLLLVMRILQGAAIGGEMPGAWIFVSEHTPAKHHGFGIGVLTSGITGGILLGSLVTIMIQRYFSTTEIIHYAWRIPFIIGGIFGFISVYMRRFLHETPIFKAIEKKQAAAKQFPILTVIKKHKLACLITALLTWGLSSAIVVIILMTPNIVLGPIYGITRSNSLMANCFATLALTFGCVIWGWISDKIGLIATLFIGWGCLIMDCFYFYRSLSVNISTVSLVINYVILGLFVGTLVTLPIVATRIFPAAVRYSGLSFSYNLAYAIFGGLTPILIGAWLHIDNMAPAYYVSLASLSGLFVAFLFLARRPLLTQHQ